MKRKKKGALCACSDMLGPRELRMASGGSIPDADNLKLWDLPELLRKFAAMEKPGAMTDEAYDARLLGARAPMRPSGSRRRPEALNASRDVNMPAQVLRGWAAGTLGLPGDIEGLARMAIPGVSNKAFFPTSEDYDEVLPGRDMTPAGRTAGGLGTLFGGAGLPTIARGVQKGSKAVAKGALETLARGMEGGGPLSGVLAPAAPRYAVRPRGGNFTNPEISDLGGWFAEGNSPQQTWADKVLRNYVKRDLGAPTDPLLALEKELPGLHLPEGRLAEEGGDVARLYAGRGDPTPLGRAADSVLKRHEALTSEPLTPWGRISDAEVAQDTAGRSLAAELEIGWPIGQLYPNSGDIADGSLRGLLDHTNMAISRMDAPSLTGKRDSLLAYRQKVDDAMASDWRAKKPDDPVYSLVGGAGERLGFDHIMDYIEAATGPYLRTKGVGSSVQTPEEMAEQAKQYVSDLLNNVPTIQQWPMRRADIDADLDMVRAGIHLDPASLDRMSVPDMVRKVAKWNEHMANKKAGNADQLMQGARVFKEYGPEAGDGAGMKWVEFGKPEIDLNASLPERYKVTEYTPGRFAVESPVGGYIEAADTAEEALRRGLMHFKREDLRTGLKAEGDAMGHCVGGYCDDVLERGTKIYSLRDAKGQPHVTVEVGPGRYAKEPYLDQLRALRENDQPGYKSYTDWLSARIAENPDYQRVDAAIAMDEWASETGYPLPAIPVPPPEIVQIKGKGNAAPVEKYLPMVQDFVKSGTWGRVGDLRNTGLIKFSGGVTTYRSTPGTEGLKLQMPKGLLTPNEAAEHLIKQGAPEAWARQQVGDFGDNQRRGYAQGGRVEAQVIDDPAPGFLPRTFEEAVDYAERVYAAHA